MNCERKSICAIEGALRWNNSKTKNKQTNKKKLHLPCSCFLLSLFIYLFYQTVQGVLCLCVCFFFPDSYQPDFGAFFHFMSCSVLISLLLQYPTPYHFCLGLLDLKHMWPLCSATLLLVKIKQKKGENGFFGQL